MNSRNYYIEFRIPAFGETSNEISYPEPYLT